MLHLHCHSQYSTLDGLSTVKEIVTKAKAMKAPAVAITDHASVSCLPEFMKEANEQGIKPIIGCEFYLVDNFDGEMKGKKRRHFNVWAKNWDGVQSIMKQLTLANTQFYYRPLLDVSQSLLFENCMVSTACCFGMLASDNWREVSMQYQTTYGDDFYLEIMPHRVVIDKTEGTDLQQIVNERAISLHIDFGINLLATNDSHYTDEEDAETHAVMMAIQYKKSLKEYDAWPAVFFMRSMQEMTDAFRSLGYIDSHYILESMLNTIKLAAKVNIVRPEFEINLPSIHDDDNSYLVDRCLQGWKKKIDRKVGDRAMEYRKRLVYELKVVKDVGFIKYFNMVEDIIRWAREQGIMVGPGRGSAAGSLICYLMDITQCDPIRHGLYFERFLNPERVELPDIDVDFQDNRRQEVIEYIIEKYGRNKVGQINTFTEFGTKSTFRDVCRAYDIDIFKVNSLGLQIDGIESFDTNADLQKFSEEYPTQMKHIRRLEGAIRGVGCHPCGIIISNVPLEQSCVMERRKDNVMVSNWDKHNCEHFGMLKMDLLGLTTLSILQMCAELVKRHYDIDIDFENPDLTDEPTLKEFAAGNCACVFQFESTGMQDLLRGLKAADFETITAATALYRPGPLNSGLTGKFVKIAKGDEYPHYPSPLMIPILEETHSIVVYQEQIMRIFHELAGFTWPQADQMRKIMGKKLGDAAFEVHRIKFVAGCLANGVDEKTSSALFDQMKEFAEYGFNKSHSVAYSTISFLSMYLKVHYPALFLASYMSCVHSDDGKKMSIREAKRLKVPVRYPDINISSDRYEFDADSGSIVAPLSAIKGVGGKAVQAILTARGDGVFYSKEDFLERIEKRACNKGVVEKMIMAGVFESLGIRESDSEIREKQMAESLPTFDIDPALSMTRDSRVDRLALERINQEIDAWAETISKKPIYPASGSSPVVMIINGLVKGETIPGTHKGAATIYHQLAAIGLPKEKIHYTTPVKVFFDDPRKASKAALQTGSDWLRAEIKAVKPKLIYCCSADAVNLFISGGKMSKLYGNVKYVKEMNCYVLFGPSPQYANYKAEQVGPIYNYCLEKISNMFSGATVCSPAQPSK